jgi:hypothetical protein
VSARQDERCCFVLECLTIVERRSSQATGPRGGLTRPDSWSSDTKQCLMLKIKNERLLWRQSFIDLSVLYRYILQDHQQMCAKENDLSRSLSSLIPHDHDQILMTVTISSCNPNQRMLIYSSLLYPVSFCHSAPSNSSTKASAASMPTLFAKSSTS